MRTISLVTRTLQICNLAKPTSLPCTLHAHLVTARHDMKILIIEDEPKTGKFLKKGLTEAGFVADIAADGRDGLHLALTENYDLVVLDVMLPGIDGWEVLREMRRARS